jgi:putative membrane protein
VDPGLQAERTAMAWQRTALGIGGVSALLLHRANGAILPSLPGIAGLLGALALLLVVEARYVRNSRHGEAGNSPMGPAMVRAVAGGSVLLAVATLLAIVTAR